MFLTIGPVAFSQPLAETFRTDDRQVKIEDLASYGIQNLYSEMLPGTIFYASGKSDRMLNYHLLFDFFYYEDGRTGYRVLDRPVEIDSIRVGDQLFTYIADSGYFEIVNKTDLGMLLIKHDLHIASEIIAPSGYGTNIRQASLDPIHTYEGTGRARVIDHSTVIHNPSGQRLEVNLRKLTQYHLVRNDGSPINISARNLILQAFPAHRSEIRTFIRRNNISLDDHENMAVLASYLLTLN